ncbi:MAG TPA: hypothetical protein ENI73_09775 [Spirochaetes bacterium]|nr:hypothetical protein [Spirochaetota bacterium]
MDFPLLPTSLVGSYSLPHWLNVVRESGREGRLIEKQLEEAHDNAVKSCIKDQEVAGLDFITDGELRRETMVYFFSKNMLRHTQK